MDKASIRNSILRYNDNSPFISVTQVAAMLHIGRDSARNLLAGLEYVANGNRKDYFVEDVARRLNDRKSI